MDRLIKLRKNEGTLMWANIIDTIKLVVILENGDLAAIKFEGLCFRFFEVGFLSNGICFFLLNKNLFFFLWL
jgi:hypothetical protein